MRRFMIQKFKWLITLVLLSGFMPFFASAAPSAASVSLTPSSPTVNACDTAEIQIWVNDVANFYAIDVRLAFDPSKIEVQDATPGGLINLRPETSWFTAGYTIKNEVNNSTGTIWYAATQTSPTPALTGSGPIATILVKGKSAGTTSLNFTYKKLSDPSGIEIPASISNGSVTATSPPVPDLSISRLNASDVRLSWTAESGVSGYHLYRSTTPYFFPADPAYQSTTSTSYDDNGVLGDESVNYFYSVRSECTDTNKSASSDQVGKFEYRLYETTGTDFNWVGLPLNVPGLSKASDLANHIQNNSSASVSTSTVSRWNAPGQNITTYLHTISFNDFNIYIKHPYRVAVDVSSGNQVVWAMVGPLPGITYDTHTLYETTGTDFNWIMQPLDMTAVTSASYLANNIQANASAPVSVLTVSRWNAPAQNITTYLHQIGFNNFTTRFGYPYRVSVDVNSGTSVTWP